MAANRNNNANNNDGGGWSWGGIIAGAVGAAAVVGGVYLAANAYFKEEPAQRGDRRDEDPVEEERDAGYLVPQGSTSIRRREIPPAPSDLVNLDQLLTDIYRRYVALKDDDFERYYGVYCGVFNTLQKHMKEADAYYAQYSSAKQFAGSHFDGLRIGRPDEFDVDILIRMPLSFREYENVERDVVLEPRGAGHVQLQAGTQFRKLPEKENWLVNKTAYAWADDDKRYLLRTKFSYWFRSVVARAINRLPKDYLDRRVITVDGVQYVITTKDSGPAHTLLVTNTELAFRLDVDLVPALKFPEARWPPSSEYREIPLDCTTGDWIVVPKPERGLSPAEAARSWRVALHAQEKRILYDLQHLRQSIRLIKKLRDSLEMKEIASYYIKTIFLWEVTNRNDPAFWRQPDSVIFKVMVRKFYEAVCARRIPYFWNEQNNLIGHVPGEKLRGYERKLKKLVDVLEERNVSLERVAEFLLTADEFNSYKYFLSTGSRQSSI